MVEIKNLSFSYGKTPLLDDISICFEKNKFYGIIGPNGCGKSTLLKLMSGILNPNSGEIFIDNLEISTVSRKDLAHRLGFMPQTRPTPDMTVFDYVLCGRFPYRNALGNTIKKDLEAVETSLTLTDTLEFAYRRVNELSGGERQRVYLALLLTQQTETVLCDEPSTHLDIKGSLSVMNILSRMRNDGKCVVTVLHDLAYALKFCDEIVVMNNGKIIDIAPPDKIIENGCIDKVFGVKCRQITTENGKNYIFE